MGILSFIDQVIKSTEETLLQKQNLDEPLVEIAFQQTEVNSKKYTAWTEEACAVFNNHNLVEIAATAG